MAAPSVHNAEGKRCRCGLVFEKQHFNITVTKPRESGYIQEKERVCKQCAHEYFSRGE